MWGRRTRRTCPLLGLEIPGDLTDHRPMGIGENLHYDHVMRSFGTQLVSSERRSMGMGGQHYGGEDDAAFAFTHPRKPSKKQSPTPPFAVFERLQGGVWGVRVFSRAMIGDKVEVHRRDGQVTTCTVRQILDEQFGSTLVGV